MAGDEFGSAMLLERQLGMGMEVAPDGGKFAVQGPDGFEDAHGCTVWSGSVRGRVECITGADTDGSRLVLYPHPLPAARCPLPV